ncbi:F-box domain protein [Aspergillus chevalieri]|uniref:Uncharacterized protein n=1 Tax=Aspergillus chevalieri TaxID=182096 RepID=A0A7R7VES0_ASPCH|nr:uncharacterized protein ACHE_10877S [Aspergillus chevalieri]BCR83475.1 hypothetical protein ACHE_10877S [Aspergillus chevalieri]
MDRPRHIEDLADELLSEVLSFLLRPEPRPFNFLPALLNPYTMTSSTSSTRGLPSEANSDLDRFRLVNKRFMRIGTPRKFSRFVVRFSEEGFKRLEHLLDMQLACYVRHFTYMVRPFYQGSGWPQVLNGVGIDGSRVPISVLRSRLENQNSLTATNRDLVLLRRAFASFPSLKQVKLLRLVDKTDNYLGECIRGGPLEETVVLDWEAACTRAIINLGIALSESTCKPIQFYTPHTHTITPEMTTKLLQVPPTLLSTIATRLTSLDITFHPITDATANITALSTVFHNFFLATTNLTSLHLSSLSHQPLSIDYVIPPTLQLTRLHTLSLENWVLNAEDLTSIIRRHSHLREFKLHTVHLLNGRWKDVLSVLRYEMAVLQRVALDHVNYSRLPDRDYRHPNGKVNWLGITPEQLRALTVDDLGDDGVRINSNQAWIWAKWVMARPR